MRFTAGVLVALASVCSAVFQGPGKLTALNGDNTVNDANIEPLKQDNGRYFAYVQHGLIGAYTVNSDGNLVYSGNGPTLYGSVGLYQDLGLPILEFTSEPQGGFSVSDQGYLQYNGSPVWYDCLAQNDQNTLNRVVAFFDEPAQNGNPPHVGCESLFIALDQNHQDFSGPWPGTDI